MRSLGYHVALLLVNMADIKPIGKALFLREEELRRGIEMMFFAYRDFTGEADSILAEQDMGRAHHRAIYFIGRHPGITVSDLLSILNIILIPFISNFNIETFEIVIK